MQWYTNNVFFAFVVCARIVLHQLFRNAQSPGNPKLGSSGPGASCASAKPSFYSSSDIHRLFSTKSLSR